MCGELGSQQSAGIGSVIVLRTPGHAPEPLRPADGLPQTGAVIASSRSLR
jgi:hypothetical protein